MKGKKKSKLIKLFTIALFAILSIVGSIFGINQFMKVKADDVVYKKGITANTNDDGTPDGTYKLSLDITGSADTTSTTAKANVIVVYDVSGSMTDNNTYMAYDTGRYGRRDGNYVNLYYRNSCSDNRVITNNTTAKPVYYWNYYNYSWHCDEYTGTRYAYVQRAAAAEKTVYDFADALFKYNKTDDADNVQMALITFSGPGQLDATTSDNDATLVQGWTNKKSDILNRLSSTGLSTQLKKANGTSAYGGGTDWEAAMRRVITVLNSKDNQGNYLTDSDPTYVVFVTDGAPTFRRTKMNGSSYNDYGHGNTTSDDIYNYRATVDEVKTIGNYSTVTHTSPNDNKDSNTSLYGIYAFGSEGNFLDDLIYASHNNGVERTNPTIATDNTPYYYSANDSDSLNQAIADIFKDIVKTLGVEAVSINDGTTDQVSVSSGEITEGMLDVDNTSFEYWLSFPVTGSGNTYKTTRKDLVSGKDYEITFTDNENGTFTATWTDSTGEHTVNGLEGKIEGTGLTKKLTYKWTGSNDLYKFPENVTMNDIAAKYEGGAIKWDLAKLGTLLDGVTYTVIVDVWPSQTTLDLIADMKNGIIQHGATKYPDGTDIDPRVWQYLDSNYNLKTNTNATVTYTDTRDENPQAVTKNYNDLDGVATNSSKVLSVSKEWSNSLDDRAKSDITLGVNRDNEKGTNNKGFYTVSLNSGNNWKNDVNISIGIMTVKNGVVKLNTPGHDYSFAEDTNISYHWELKAPTVHPMQINGQVKMLVLLEDKDVPANLKSITTDNAEYTQGSDTYYKLTINGTVKYYKVDNALASLTATNERRSYLDIEKKVEGVSAPKDAKFDYNIKVTDANGEDIWFSVYDKDKKPVFDLETNATAEIKDNLDLNSSSITYEGNIDEIAVGDIITYKYKGNDSTVKISEVLGNGKFKYYSGSYSIGSGATINVKLMADWNLRVFNLPMNSSYEVTEVTNTMASGFVLKSVKDQANNTSTNALYKGSIAASNTAYKVTYTNEFIKTEVPVTKVWNDNNNQDGKRKPFTITLTGKVGNTEVISINKEFTQTEIDAITGNEMHYTFEDLNVYNGNVHTEENKIVYTVDETVVPADYAKTGPTGDAVNGYTITNTHTPEITSVSVTKEWADNNNQDGIRGSYTVTLTGTDTDGTVTKTDSQELGAATLGYTWSDLPVYQNGKKVTYTVSETAKPDGYTPSVSGSASEGFTITNSHTPAETSVTVNKTWSDNNDQDGLRNSYEVTLTGTAEGYSKTYVETLTKDKLTHTWNNLPVKNNGKDITYTVSETKVPDGYTASVAGNASEGFTITNSHTPAETSVTVNKTWNDNNDQDGLRNSYEVTLTGTAEGYSKTYTETLTKDKLTHTWNNLPVKNNGKTITYTVSETKVPEGYTASVAGNATAGFTITNTHNPAETSVTVNKTWNDNNDQDGLRNSYEVTLTGTAEGYSKTYVETLAKDKLTHTWNNLPVKNNGKDITYTVSETKVPDGYTATVGGNASEGFAITNSHTPAETSVTVNKVWSDSNDQDGMRNSYEVTLTGTAEGYSKTYVETLAKDKLTHIWNNLPVKNNGKDITYTVSETKVPDGYTATYASTGTNTFTITNTHKPETINIPVSKTWADNNDQDGHRPKSITIILLNGTETVKRQVVTPDEQGNWATTFVDLPKKANGVDIQYTIEELHNDVITGTNGVGTYKDEISGSIANGFTVTNTHTSETTSVTVNKTWNDNNDQDGLRNSYEVTLTGTAEGYSKTYVETLTKDKLTHTWSDLPVYNNKNKITYTVSETKVPDGYTATVGGNASEGFTITNSHTPAETSVTVNKTWNDNNDQDGLRNSYEVTLTGTAEGYSNTYVETLTKDKLTHTWNNLPVKNNGKDITYTVSETKVPDGYTASVAGNASEGFTITNTHNPAETSVIVNKVWSDNDNQDGMRNSYEVTLTGTAEGYSKIYVETLAKDKLTHTWNNLPVKNNGKDITYTVSETKVPDGYTAGVTGNASEGFTITNSHTPLITSVKVAKKWADKDNQDGNRPDEITVNLLANNEVVDTKKITPDKEGNWTYEFVRLPQYRAGTKLTYTVSEEVPEGYSPAYATLEDGTILITNSYTPELTHVDVTKVWDDASNQDGVRPGSIKVNLLADGNQVESKVVNSQNADRWTVSFTGLPKYRDGGTEIIYTITEDKVDNYETKIEGFTITNTHKPAETSVTVNKTWDDSNNQDGMRESYEVTLTGTAEGGYSKTYVKTLTKDELTHTWNNLPVKNNGKTIIYTVEETKVPEGYSRVITKESDTSFKITNTHKPITTSVAGKKSWVDMDNIEGFRPEEITVNLIADGGETPVKTIKVNADKTNDYGDWLYEFTDLPKYRDGGTEIKYTVTEDTVKEYTTTYELDDNKNPYIIVNTHTPNKLNLTVNKVWEDTSKDGIKNIYGHTDTISVKLTGKVGDKVYEEQTVDIKANEDGDWTYTFENLPEYREGKLINYTVIELTDVENYTVSYSSSDEDKTYTITNTYDPELISIEGTKTWLDEEDNDGIRPEKIEVTLKDNYDNIIKTIEVTADSEGNWKYTFDNLPKTVNGEDIKYTVSEKTVEGYETEITDYDITNKHNIAKVSFSIEKIWNDNNNNDGIRPTEITVNLLADGETVATAKVTPNEEGKWLYEFKDLNKYKEGKLVEYEIVETPVAGYTTEVTKPTENNNTYTITNTHNDETIEITITKSWDDLDNVANLRPSEITVKLYANGKLINTLTITEADGWKKTVTDLPKFENGNEIVYTIIEEEIPEYDATYDGFNITNKHELGKGNGPEEDPPQTGVVKNTSKNNNNNNNIVYMILMLLSLLGINIQIIKK